MNTNIPIITVCSHPEHATGLINSAKKYGWDLEVIKCDWKGFGTKLIETYNYLKAHPEVEQFVFADAFDVVVLGTPDEFENKIYHLYSYGLILSTERGLWPPILHPFKNKYGYAHPSYNGFLYPNSGLYFCKSDDFKHMIETYPPFNEIDDQYWMNMVYLFEQEAGDNANVSIGLDHFQSIFNSHSFIANGEYTYHQDTKRIEIMGNFPIFVHQNGKTVDEKLNQMLEEIGL